ncbi:MAG: YbaB/EbfC family nucleoid-associated protein [Bacillota bacterium]
MAKGGGFPGMGGGMNMQQMMKQAQKMQQDMEKLQQEIAQKELTASSGGGMVTVTINGHKDILKVRIKPECVDPSDVEMLEDLVMSAVNEALRMAEELTTTEMNKVTGGMNLGF